MQDRYVFANQLRGAAALCVVVSHFAGVYWVEPQLVAAATFSPPAAFVVPGFVALIAPLNLGAYGVGLFFLISGFVIPLSLQRLQPGAFLVARAFRIYPTYLLAFSIEFAVIGASAIFWHRPLTYGAGLLLANAFLVTDVVNVPSIDLVNWTLTVELKFYVLMALLAVPIRRGSVATLFAVAAVIALVTRLSQAVFLVLPGLGHALQIFESNAIYLLFMLIGVVFSFHARGQIRPLPALIAGIALYALVFVCWPLTFFRGEYPAAPIGYGCALATFFVFYIARERVPRTRIADFFADISYPLYLVHSLVGYTIMQLLIARHVDPIAAMAAAFAVVALLALGLHGSVETRSQAFGKMLAAGVATRIRRALSANS